MPRYILIAGVTVALLGTVLMGCAKNDTVPADDHISESASSENVHMPLDEPAVTEVLNEGQQSKPIVTEMDWSDYFAELDGCAVFYDPAANQYTVYNRSECQTPHSPCSTFKIVSSLVALEKGIVVPEDSVRGWSGEEFAIAEWNRDLDFADAFRASCVWYFREVVDEIGQETMQSELNRLQYGNCDISDWEGIQNADNHNRALTGFWIESSLQISPFAQVEVMERIFGKKSAYQEQSLDQLKAVMLVSEDNGTRIYGKTGTGQAGGEVVDAWFTGFAETADGNFYYCVYLGKSESAEVSGVRAKEIALELIADHNSCFEALHTTGENYIIEDIDSYIKANLK